MREDSSLLSTAASQSLPWRHVGIALVIGIVGTPILGVVPLLLLDNIWGLALGGLVALFLGGVYLGRQARDPEPLYGTVLAILYFGLISVILFGGELTEQLPNPLPGLEIGDSTFFFVVPLLQLAAGVAGTVTGGLLAKRLGSTE